MKIFFGLLFFLILFSCNDSNSPSETAVDIHPLLKAVEPGHNNRLADRINLIIVGKGYQNMNEFLTTMNRDLGFDGLEKPNLESLDKLLFGLFAIEPFKSQRSKFNLWYYPEQLQSKSPEEFLEQNRDNPGRSAKDFGLPFATYLFFVNPVESPQSFAYPSNVPPGVAPVKSALVFGSATVTRYPNVADGVSVVAHELGHSIFNLRDEYVRTGSDVGDRYGHNIARTQAEARQLWGSVESQVDPFYYTWKEKMITNGFWIDSSNPLFVQHDAKKGVDIYTWHPNEEEIKVGYLQGGGVTTTGISWRPTKTSLMNNEDVRDKSWPSFPPVFGSANRRVMQSVLDLYSGK